MALWADVEIVDELIGKESKVLEGYQPQWGFQAGYRDYQLSWPILEEDTQRIRSQLRIRVPEHDMNLCSISFIYRNCKVCRLDRDRDDVVKVNNPFGRRLGLPPEVSGLHIHAWEDNRQFILTTEKWDIPLRRPVTENLRDINAMFLWFCEHINVRIQSHNTPLALPDVGLWGSKC